MADNPNGTGTENSNPDGKNGETSSTGDGTGDNQSPKTFTQDEVQRLIAKEVKPLKARIKAGQTAEEKLEALEAQAKTEQEKAVEEAYKKGQEAKDAEVFKARVEGRVLSAMARHGIPDNLLSAVLGDLGEIEDLDAVSSAMDELVKDQPNVYGVFSKPPSPKGQEGSPAHGSAYPSGGVWTLSQIRDVRSKGLYGKYRESILAAHQKGEVVVDG